jgi:NADP-dependent 3-hydroxy acid dehydrogenase YdfG
MINNGSISASAPRPNSIAYTSTKHGVAGLTKSASLDGRKYDIAIEPLMDVAIVGQSVLYMVNLPLEVNVVFHTVMATKMPFVGRG